MRKINKNLITALAISVALGVAGPFAALAATTPSLGTAATFGVLSSTFTPTIASTAITGDLGYTTLSTALFFTVSGSTYTNVSGVPSGAAYQQAGTDQNTALNGGSDGLNVQAPCTPISGTLDGVVVGANPPGTFPPGCYAVTGAMNITATTNITLLGSGTYIFKSSGALTTGANSQVLLSGASACDVFWAPVGATTLGANSTFIGTDIDAAGISVGDTVNWTGRALAFGGTVTTNHDIITVPSSCVTPPAPSTPAVTPTPITPTASSGVGISSGGGRIVPLIGVVKVPTPLALPAGPGQVTYNYTVWNVGGQQPLDDVTVTDDACSPVTYVSGDTNGNGKIDPHEDWKYTCTTTLGATTKNTAIATGYSDDVYHQASIATAIATVVVGEPITPPLINIVKIPSQLTPLSYGGGNVTYTYTVTNPGVVAMNNVIVSDNKCAPISGPSGDTNGNNLLDPGEAWVYTCQTNVPVSTTDTAVAEGSANGFTATGYAFATVLVSTPGLPNTGFPPKTTSASWDTVALIAAALGLVSASLAVALRKRKI